jgi:hypothetical protein
MPTDALIQLQASVTKTSTFSSAALNLPGGTPRRGLKARVIYSAGSSGTATSTAIFSIDVSHDGGSNYYTEAESDPITLPTSGSVSGEIFVPFEVSPTSVANQINIKLTCTIAPGSSATPSITYVSDLTVARP